MLLTDDQQPATLQRHLLMNERVVVATRHHWASLIEPYATVGGAFLVVAWLTSIAEGPSFAVAQYFWMLWLLLVGRAMWKSAEWFNEWFAVTDKRLLKTYGLITRNVAMMPLRKVTDMNYTRSPFGRVLGYGAFELESAGQDQAMREIKWLPRPDDIYQRVGDAVFGPAGRDPDEDGPDPEDEARRARWRDRLRRRRAVEDWEDHDDEGASRHPGQRNTESDTTSDAGAPGWSRWDPEAPSAPYQPRAAAESAEPADLPDDGDESTAWQVSREDADLPDDGDETAAWQVSREDPGRPVDVDDEDNTGPIPPVVR